MGGWSRELERCTTAPLLVASLKLNVEAERDIWGGTRSSQRHKHTSITDTRKAAEHRHKTPDENLNTPRTQRWELTSETGQAGLQSSTARFCLWGHFHTQPDHLSLILINEKPPVGGHTGRTGRPPR